MGRFLLRGGLAVDGVVCSSAARALETAQGLLRGMESKRDAEPVPELYNASGPELLGWLQGVSEDYSKLVLVAHMPGVGELLSLLTTEHYDLVFAFTPATLAIVTGEDKWADWDYGRGMLQALVPAVSVPKA